MSCMNSDLFAIIAPLSQSYKYCFISSVPGKEWCMQDTRLIFSGLAPAPGWGQTLWQHDRESSPVPPRKVEHR